MITTTQNEDGTVDVTVDEPVENLRLFSYVTLMSAWEHLVFTHKGETPDAKRIKDEIIRRLTFWEIHGV